MSGYTIVQHEIVDSAAARAVSAGARCVLFDFLRRWSRVTRNGTRPVAAIMFTWAGSCEWPVSRKAWEKYRAELVEKGFLSPGPAYSGRYGFADGWRRYRPSPAEQKQLAAHDARRRQRWEQTKRLRGPNRPTPSASIAPPDATDPHEPFKTAHHHGAKTSPQPASQTDAPATTSVRPLQPGGGGVRFEVVEEKRVQVWPPPDFDHPAYFLAWANRVHHFFTQEEYKTALAMYEDLREKSRAAEEHPPQPTPPDGFAEVAEEEAARHVAAVMNVSGPRALQRVQDVMRLHGRDAAWKAAIQLTADGTPHAKWLPFFEYRARMLA